MFSFWLFVLGGNDAFAYLRKLEVKKFCLENLRELEKKKIVFWHKYILCVDEFETCMSINDLTAVQDVLMAHLQEQVKTEKSITLWLIYSMLYITSKAKILKEY